MRYHSSMMQDALETWSALCHSESDGVTFRLPGTVR